MRLPVFLSASEPYRTSALDPGILRDPAYADSASLVNIRAALRAFCAHVLPSFPLVYGGHPAVTPLVRGMRQALLREQKLYREEGQALEPLPPVLIYQSAFYPGVSEASDPTEPMVLLTPPSNAEGQVHDREHGDLEHSLLFMRYDMLGVPSGYLPKFTAHAEGFGRRRLMRLNTVDFAAGVFIGGMESVFIEFRLFQMFHPKTPAYALATTGGAALELRSEMRHQSSVLRERLVNDTAYGLLMQHLLPVTRDGSSVPGHAPTGGLVKKLKAAISWKSTDPDIAGFLDKLQGNILKGHGRSNVVFMFCRFRQDLKAEALAFLRSQIARVRSAKQQLLAADHKRQTGQKDTDPFVSIFLSKSGYDYFKVSLASQPADHAFQCGMAAAPLGDPPQGSWDSQLRNPHALILIAVSDPDQAQTETTDLLNAIGQIGDVEAGQSGEIIGNQFFNTAGNGVENFGYVDGRSQPLMLREDIPSEGGINKWPVTEFPVDQFVIPDPAAADPFAYGSYFVFRQLEQDVFGFKTREDELTDGRSKTFPP